MRWIISLFLAGLLWSGLAPTHAATVDVACTDTEIADALDN